MRPLKFRAWDESTKTMYYQEKPQGLYNPYLSASEILKRFETIMQFTGLKDKNGKEIYGGDVLLYIRKHWHCVGHPAHKKDLKETVEVFWNDEKHGFWANHYNEERCYSSGNLSFEDERADKNIIEIIGNIYENPELLTKEER